MGYRFEFDSVNKILLLRVEGRFTDELLAQGQPVVRKYWAATAPGAGIVDLSPVTEFAVSTESIRRLADQKLVVDATMSPIVIAAPETFVFGVSRMFQLLGEPKRPQLQVVRTLEEALAALGIQSPNFEPLE